MRPFRQWCKDRRESKNLLAAGITVEKHSELLRSKEYAENKVFLLNQRFLLIKEWISKLSWLSTFQDVTILPAIHNDTLLFVKRTMYYDTKRQCAESMELSLHLYDADLNTPIFEANLNTPVSEIDVQFPYNKQEHCLSNAFIQDITGKHNKGYGSILMTALINQCNSMGITLITGTISDVDADHIDRLCHFYQKFGFTITDNDRIYLNLSQSDTSSKN